MSGVQALLDSMTQTGNANNGDWQEEVYQKIKAMKEAYLLDLNEMYQKIAGKIQQHESLPQQPKTEGIEKLKLFKALLERNIAVLQVSKSNISPGLKDKLGAHEKQIIQLLNTKRLRKPGPPLQPGQQATLPSPAPNPPGEGSLVLQSQGNQGQAFPISIASSPAQARHLSQTVQNNMSGVQGNANNGDWQEEAYQKIQAMKEAYLPDLNEMCQKIAGKLQQDESLPQQPRTEGLEKLRLFKALLERSIAFLQVSKSNISPALKDKLGAHEKLILQLLNVKRLRYQPQIPQARVFRRRRIYSVRCKSDLLFPN